MIKPTLKGRGFYRINNYEIRAISDHFLSKGVLAVSSDYRNPVKAAFAERAKQMDIDLWGTDTLWNLR